MASKKQEEILREFESAARAFAAPRSEDAGSRANGSATAMTTADATTRPATSDGVAATPAGQNVLGGSKTETQSSGGSTAETVIKDVFESGFGVIPLIGNLLGLFGGGSGSPPPLAKYQMPSSISFLSAETPEGLSAANYDQMGMPRAYDSGDAASSGTAPATSATKAAQGAQITVNVQAMDSQSFLDRSGDIAEAVRRAMLSLSSINDVVNEL